MKAATRYLLHKLIDEKKEYYERAIYSLNVSRIKGCEQFIKRHQKKISDLEKAREDLIGGRDTPK